MSYCVYDSNGYVGDLATNKGLDDLLSFLSASGGEKLQALANDGQAPISQAFKEELVSALLLSAPEDVKATLHDLVQLVAKSQDIIIITDGVFDGGE